MGVRRILLGTLACVSAFYLPSCERSRPAAFPAYDAAGAAFELRAADLASAAGELKSGASAKLTYSLKAPLPLPAAGALELEYRVSPGADASFVCSVDGERSWALPPDAGFLGMHSDSSPTIRYRFPLSGTSFSGFSVEAKYSSVDKRASKDATYVPAFTLRAVRVMPRQYGYLHEDGAHLLTPFVYREESEGAVRFSIEAPAEYLPSGPLGLRLRLASAPGKLTAGDQEYRYVGRSLASSPEPLSLLSGSLPESFAAASYESAEPPAAFLLASSAPGSFPVVPVTADPGLVLSYRQEAWRDPRYEVFRWERFPGILIFDTADYAVQERLFKRLAFFVEKAGFRGRLSSDSEIADLHGWNAHDYRAEDLAAFFDLAARTSFPLNAEERELFAVLESAGIVKTEAGRILPGTGAIISISRESVGYLRTLFMAHEAWHGLFFIDSGFRDFAAERYAALPEEPKRFLKAYFDSRRYDVGDAYLMKNELMAYVLQQPLGLVGRYFGDTLPTRLEKDERRRRALPSRSDGPVPYPTLAEAFLREAAAFDAFTASRYGLRAGRVALVYQISRTNAAR